ncbi:MAG: NADP-dependent oxidoreductase [Caldilineaceae bacterium]
MSQITSREIRLKSHPVGMPTGDNFELATVVIAPPERGQVLVRNLYMSVDPYMRGRMIDRKSYAPPFRLGEPLTGGAVGQVVESNAGPFQVGDFVLSMQGWREYYLSDGKGLTHIDPSLLPIQAFLGVAGMPGLTAYVGLLDIGQPKVGETVLVSGAAGAVGSMVCQIARIKGCRVVASAGADDKVDWLLKEARVDAAFNYKKVDNLRAELAKHCPNGLDVYFDNVGGEHLEAALDRMNNYGRVVACGMIAQYNATEPTPAPRNLSLIIGKRIRIQGFIISDHANRQPQFLADLREWLTTGKLTYQETIDEGLENAPKAFLSLFTGHNYGKMLVKIGPDPA